MTDPLLLGFLAVFGLAVGSFVNVVIVRVPSDESILHPPSKCPLCQHPIAHRDNIPVISWLLLRGKCRHCANPIPAGYPLVELANAVLWVAAGLRFGLSWELIPFALLFSALLALTVIDLELYLLPNKITYPLFLASVPTVVALSFGVRDDTRWALEGAGIGVLAFAGGLLVTMIVGELVMRKEALGMGDVKLAATLGLWLGWLHPVLVLYALIGSSLLGVVAGAVVLIIRRESQPYPFGPWLALGTVAVILASEPILRFAGFRV